MTFAFLGVAVCVFSAIYSLCSAEPLETCWQQVWSQTPMCNEIATADSVRLCISQSKVSKFVIFYSFERSAVGCC